MGGGISGESKQDIYQKIPQSFLPKTFFVDRNQPDELERILPLLCFPVFAKPDVGKRGRLVEKIDDPETLVAHYQQLNIPLVIQEDITYKEEFSVYYYCFPEDRTGKVISLVTKEYPSILGDGIHSVEQLIDKDRRLTFFANKLKPYLSAQTLSSVPLSGETKILSTIGNHSRGTIFHDSRAQIDDALRATFDDFFQQLEGIHIGRVDLKAPSLADLKKGTFQVVEINGLGAELAHIYSTGYSLLNANREIFNLWDIIYKISTQNRAKGVEIVPIRKAFTWFITYIRYSRNLKSTSN
ncbi:MAG: D-alanine--D-alanine ligase [Saprospiraceae bacterium]|nr:MAG: D-alanine--D-alanine ligase [Saprospiraceae bacterium]